MCEIPETKKRFLVNFFIDKIGNKKTPDIGGVRIETREHHYCECVAIPL